MQFLKWLYQGLALRKQNVERRPARLYTPPSAADTLQQDRRNPLAVDHLLNRKRRTHLDA